MTFIVCDLTSQSQVYTLAVMITFNTILSTVSSTGWFDALNDKATIAHFTADKFGVLAVLIPPLSEQTAIATHLDKVTTGIESAIQRAKRQIQLFREYRARLIADVVTGKLDVREAAVRLLDTDPIDAKADGIDSACESTGAECDEMLVVAENEDG